MTELTSVQNPAVRRVRALKDKKAREAQGEMLVEGEKLMLEAAQAGLSPSDVFIEREQAERYASLAGVMERAGARAPARLYCLNSAARRRSRCILRGALPQQPRRPSWSCQSLWNRTACQERQ